MARQRTYTVVALAFALLLLIAGIQYSRFVQKIIFEESSDHLAEIYGQVDTSFTTLVNTNWALLDSWEPVIEYLNAEAPDPNASLQTFFQGAQGTWGFTGFYFLDADGNYMTLEGGEGKLDLGSQAEALAAGNQHIVAEVARPASAQSATDAQPAIATQPTANAQPADALTVFVAPTDPATYRGFNYSAIAIGYSSADIAATLNVAPFENEASCYIVFPDTHIPISANPAPAQPSNFQSYLEHNATLKKGTFADVADAIARGETGTVEYALDGVSYYLSYQPVGVNDWALVGIVPTEAVNASIDQIHQFTITSLLVMFALASAAGATFLVYRSHRKLDAKALELRYREELFGVLANTTNDIFIMLAGDMKTVRYVSPNIERLIGIPADAVRHNIRTILNTAVNPADSLLSAEADPRNAADLKPGTYLQSSCERIHQRTGERRWYLETLYPISIDGTKKYILVLADRTNERQSNAILEQALELAKQSNEAKGRFLAKMSHDIRTPINAITGMTVIARENVNNAEKVSECLRVVENASHHLLGLLNDVLDMSKIESGQIMLQEEPCTMDEVMREVEDIIAPQAQAKRQSLSIRLENVRHRALAVDRVRLDQVLLNLLSNAVKYTPEGGTIGVVVTELEQDCSQTHSADRAQIARMQFEVTDNGIGMPEEFISRIFEPFERSSQEDVDNIMGTGLGMPITKAIVDAMGGTISIKSAVGQGSTFTVRIDLPIVPTSDPTPAPSPNSTPETAADPAAAATPTTTSDPTSAPSPDQAPAATETAAPADPPPYELAGRHFLIVEDNDINAEILTELLSMEGATSDWAVNGKIGVETFAAAPAGHYDAILMDVMMPVMGGYEATATIRALAREGERPDAADILIVALTANAFAEDVQKALDAGMNAHIAKPTKISAIKRTLAELEAARA